MTRRAPLCCSARSLFLACAITECRSHPPPIFIYLGREEQQTRRRDEIRHSLYSACPDTAGPGGSRAGRAPGCTRRYHRGIRQASQRGSQRIGRGAALQPHRRHHVHRSRLLEHPHNQHAPTFNRLARDYGLATRYYTTSDPDTAGIMAFLAGNSFGVTTRSVLGSARPQAEPAQPAGQAHKSWKEYVQDLPYPGYLVLLPDGVPGIRHAVQPGEVQPGPDLTSVADNPAQARKMVPASELAADARAGRLPDFSLINANECADMHGGPPWCEDSSNAFGEPNDNKLVAGRRRYLRQVTREIMSGPQWRHGNNAIVVTWTEGVTSAGLLRRQARHRPGLHDRGDQPRSPAPHRRRAVQPLLAAGSPSSTLRARLPAAQLRHPARACRWPGCSAPESDGREASPGRAPAAAGNGGSPASRAGRRPRLPADSGIVVDAVWQARTPAERQRPVVDLWPVARRTSGRSARCCPSRKRRSYRRSPCTTTGRLDAGQDAELRAGSQLPVRRRRAAGRDRVGNGIYTQASGHTGRALTVHWNGHRWTIVPAANPGAADDMLYSATAVTTSDVWAVGTYGDADGFFHPLIEHWNGHHWTAAPHRWACHVADGILSSVTSVRGEASGLLASSSGARPTGRSSCTWPRRPGASCRERRCGPPAARPPTLTRRPSPWEPTACGWRAAPVRASASAPWWRARPGGRLQSS